MRYLIKALKRNGYSAVHIADDDSLCHVRKIETGEFVTNNNGEPVTFDQQELEDFLEFVEAN